MQHGDGNGWWNGGSGIVVVRYQIGQLQQLQKQLVVLLVSMVVKPFIPLQVLELFCPTSGLVTTKVEYVIVVVVAVVVQNNNASGAGGGGGGGA